MFKTMSLLLAVFWSVASLYANNPLDQQLWQDYLSTGLEEVTEGQLWLLNDSVYQQNEAGQWIRMISRNKLPMKHSWWLQDLMDRGVCPRGHKGVFFDRTFEKPGVWYCRGIVHDGKKCPYHIDNQFQNGKSNG